MKLDWHEGELAEGLRQYRAGEFFAAHEAWESAWLRAPEPEKTFLQALIQIAAAFHHIHRNNAQGALSLLQSAMRKLMDYPTHFGGIEVRDLCTESCQCVLALQRGTLPMAAPTIKPVEKGRDG